MKDVTLENSSAQPRNCSKSLGVAFVRIIAVYELSAVMSTGQGGISAFVACVVHGHGAVA